MQTLAFFMLLGAGVVACAVLARTATLRWRLPWREALMYFGVVPYPHETAPPPQDSH